MAKKKEFSFEEYVKSLTPELGSHYRYEHYAATWLGFIYCECYYGKNFVCWPPTWSKNYKNDENRPPLPMLIPGAVARVEATRVIILDHRQDYFKNGSLRHAGSRYCDKEFIDVADPEFHKKFQTIKAMHNKNAKYFGVSVSPDRVL